MKYPWYSIVNSPTIEQEDLLLDIEIPVVRHAAGDTPPVEMETYDVIIMTQSCDIPKASIRHLIMCPVWELQKAAKVHPEFVGKDGKEQLRKGRTVAFHLLNKCGIPGFERDYLVVQFERVIERPKGSIIEFAAKQNERVRLMPPYREHLAQAFARFFMRVGLPIDIPAFKK